MLPGSYNFHKIWLLIRVRTCAAAVGLTTAPSGVEWSHATHFKQTNATNR